MTQPVVVELGVEPPRGTEHGVLHVSDCTGSSSVFLLSKHYQFLVDQSTTELLTTFLFDIHG